MTLEEYYKALEQIKAPAEMDWYEKGNFYKNETEKLRSKLSKEDLKKVLKYERRWADRMQSEAGMPILYN